nr:MAG TPA: hypothetical protein [Inoviridae sp.]
MSAPAARCCQHRASAVHTRVVKRWWRQAGCSAVRHRPIGKALQEPA